MMHYKSRREAEIFSGARMLGANSMIHDLVLRWASIAVIGVALFGLGCLKGCQHEQAKADRFEASTRALGEAQAAHAKAVNAEQSSNLRKVSHDLLQNIQAAGGVAVANYVRAHPVRVCGPIANGGGVSGDSSGQPGDDASSGKQLVTDGGFVGACARDAARLNAWIEYCALNRCPVENPQ